MSVWIVLPSRLDGLDGNGRLSRNPFMYNGISPSFFKEMRCNSEAHAQAVKLAIERRNVLLGKQIWVGYIYEETDDAGDRRAGFGLSPEMAEWMESDSA